MAGVVDRGSRFQIWWTVDGMRQWETLDKAVYSKRQAKREASKREVEGAVKRVHTLKALMDVFVVGRVISESTRYKIEKLVQEFEAFLISRKIGLDIGGISEHVVNDYLAQKQKTYKPPSVNFDIIYLRQLFKKAVVMGWMKVNPMESIRCLREERSVKQLPTKDELEKILSWFLVNEPFFYAWIYFEMTRGWRRDELRLMRIEDIDLSAEILYVRHTKTGVERRERLQMEDCCVLNEHLIHLKTAKLYRSSGYLFPSKKGDLICKNTLLRKIKLACKSLGIAKNITNHLFRHYVVTRLLDNSGNTEVVKAITGHKDTKTILEHYAHATPENVKRGLDITRLNTGLKVKNVSKSVSKEG